MNRSGDYSHFTSSNESSGDEGRLVIDNKKLPSRKRISGSLSATVVASDSDEDIQPPPKKARYSKIQPAKLKMNDHEAVDISADSVKVNCKKTHQKPKIGFSNITRAMLNADEVTWQKAMDLAVSICTPLKVDVKELTMLPDIGTLECFKKAAQAWLNERKMYVPLTFSTQKTMQTIMGRFLLDFVIKSVGLDTVGWNPSGCVIWQHKCGNKHLGLHCLHGLPMLNKEQVIEMDVNSENGQRALKDNPQKTKITTNRWNRNVVQIKNEDAACCPNDASTPAGSFSGKSCAMFFSDAPKAMQAFQQIIAFQSACYPKMSTSSTHILMPVKCDCNWGWPHFPLLGRQVCKITPYSIETNVNVENSNVDDPKLMASVNNPAVLVFQCCNPVYRNTRANAQKNCDFKISAPDLISALQLSKQMWLSIANVPAPIRVPEFKWDTQYQHQTVILPVDQHDDDDCLF